ncbi:MAG TPA: helix-turn-helix transcriptional regulator [Candidatus Didemnitutus sp.]|jgi:transcriptional regulator with XRE-family HTH domain
MSKLIRPSLRALRQAAGLSLREVARQIEVEASNLSLWERTGKLPRADVIVPLAEALGVTPEEILGQDKPAHGDAPKGRVRDLFEQVQKLPRRQQDQILDVVDALLAKAAKDRR